MFEHLIKDGLVKQKRYDNGLSVFKYSRKVFYDGLWDTDPLLLEARGIVLSDDGEVVVHPFTKVFNYGENGAGELLEASAPIIAPRKVNGFMAAGRYWNGELIVSTTGSLDSDFAVLARTHIEAMSSLYALMGYAEDYTLLFEICDPSDPHIVEEEAGAYLIGARFMLRGSYEGQMLSEAGLDGMADVIGAKRPEVFRGTFGELWELVRTCKHEGWMVIDEETGETLFKIKSPHYLTKKFLMRMGQKKVTAMFEDKDEFIKSIEEEFVGVVDYITSTYDKNTWGLVDERQRRAVIERFFENGAFQASNP